MKLWVHILYMDIIMSTWCPLYFSETSTFMIRYRIRGVHLPECHLKNVHTPLSWLVTLTCMFALVVRQAHSHASTRLCHLLPVTHGLSPWLPREAPGGCGGSEASALTRMLAAQEPAAVMGWPCLGMRQGRCRVDVLSGCTILGTQLFYGLEL